MSLNLQINGILPNLKGLEISQPPDKANSNKGKNLIF